MDWCFSVCFLIIKKMDHKTCFFFAKYTHFQTNNLFNIYFHHFASKTPNGLNFKWMFMRQNNDAHSFHHSNTVTKYVFTTNWLIAFCFNLLSLGSSTGKSTMQTPDTLLSTIITFTHIQLTKHPLTHNTKQTQKKRRKQNTHTKSHVRVHDVGRHFILPSPVRRIRKKKKKTVFWSPWVFKKHKNN